MSEADSATSTLQINLTADIIVAYVSKNSVPVSELANLLSSVHAALGSLAAGGSAAPLKNGVEKPNAAQIKKSVTADGLISFEDGKSYKTLRRHLTTRGLSPEAYREKWGLSHDYPMTAPSYSAQRSALAKSLGLGQFRRDASAETIEDGQTSEETSPAKRRGRPPGQTKASEAA